MTAVDVLGSVDELPDGTGGSVDVVTEAKIGPYRKSRLKRLGRPDDVAPVFVFLASDEARYFCGQTLGPNGGEVMP